MIVKQLSAFVENKAGRLAEIAEQLAKEEVDSSIEVQPQFKDKRFSLGGQFRVEMESFTHGKLVVTRSREINVLLPRWAVKSRVLAA